MGRNLLVRLLRRLRPSAVVVPQFIGREVAFGEPGACLQSDDVQTGLSERERCDPSDRSEADDHDVRFFEPGRHVYRPAGAAPVAAFVNIS